MASFNVWAAVRTLKGRIGINKGLAIAQRLNPDLTEEEWRAATAEARAILRNKAEEMTRPLSRRPIASEILDFAVTNPGGFIQQTEVYVRDNETQLIETRHFTYKTDTLRSRANVVKEVWAQFNKAIEDDPTGYPEEVVGVAYVGTYRLVPKK